MPEDEIIMPKYKCCDFSEVEHVGVICRGASLKHIGKYKKGFKNCLVAGQYKEAFKKIGKHIKGNNIVRVSGTIVVKPDGYVRLYDKYGIQDLQTGLPVDESDRRKKRLDKMKTLHAPLSIEVHAKPCNFRSRNRRFCYNINRNKSSHPTTGLYCVDLAAAFKPKKISIIGLDFYCSNYFAREAVMCSIKKNRGRCESMMEYFLTLCKYEPDIQFVLYTACKKIKSQKNLKVVYV